MKTGLAVPKSAAAHKLILYAVNNATDKEIGAAVAAIKHVPINYGKFNEVNRRA